MTNVSKADKTIRAFAEYMADLYKGRKYIIEVDSALLEDSMKDMVYACVEPRDAFDTMITYNFVVTKSGAMYQVVGKSGATRKKYIKMFSDLKIMKY